MGMLFVSFVSFVGFVLAMVAILAVPVLGISYICWKESDRICDAINFCIAKLKLFEVLDADERTQCLGEY